MGTTRQAEPSSRASAPAAVLLPEPGMPASATSSGRPGGSPAALSLRASAAADSHVRRGPCSRRPRKSATARASFSEAAGARAAWPASSRASVSALPRTPAAMAPARREARALQSTNPGTYSSSTETAINVGAAMWPSLSCSSRSLRSEENMSSSVMRPVSDAKREAVTKCGGPSNNEAARGMASSPRPSAIIAAARSRYLASSSAAPPSPPPPPGDWRASLSLTGACRTAAFTCAARWPTLR
mmetsp:Transcript_24636/g.70933  ORF Transcript_24636/g.70933 Transcript_24636/m.70933 type:complete len:243 (-) Transcript_24636:238-966(-)